MTTFQIISWYTNDHFFEEDEEERYLVKIFGVTQEGKSVAVNLTDFPPYFYIKLTEPFRNYTLSSLRESLINKLPNAMKTSLLDVKLWQKKDFWGFSNKEKFNFIRYSFKNIKTYRKAIYIFQKEKKKLYESNIEPFLRLIHIRNIEPTGWVTIAEDACNVNLDILPTTCEIDITCKWNAISPVKIEKIAPITVASFDLECNSSHGDFPTPKKNYKKLAYELVEYLKIHKKDDEVKSDIFKEILNIFDHKIDGKLSKVFVKYNDTQIKKKLQVAYDEIFTILSGKLCYHKTTELKYTDKKVITELTRDEIIKKLTIKFGDFDEMNTWRGMFPPLHGDQIIQIGTTLHNYGSTEISKKHILTLGTCDELDDIEVETCKTEEELLLKWRDFIVKTNPDIITGYNIFGFDMSYMFYRASELGIKDAFCKLSKIKDKVCTYYEKTLTSSGLGENLLKYIAMEGRVCIDVMKCMQRDHKLDSYKLDLVANTFLGGKVISIEDDYTCIFDNIKGLKDDSYIKLGENKYKIKDIVPYGKHYKIILYEKLEDIEAKTWGLAKDDITPQQIFQFQKGSSKDRALVAKYCIQDCALCNYLIMKLEILANNIGMSNVCNVPFEYIFMRGQGIKIFSLVAKLCREEEFIIPTITPKRNENNELEDDDDESFEGAIVLEPKQGIYIDHPVIVLDYASLYPSSMISENLSHDCYVIPGSKYDNLPGIDYLNIKYDIFEKDGDKKIKIGEQVCRFVQFPDEEKGMLPRILQKLLTQRKLTRKKIEFKTIYMTNGKSYSGLLKECDNSVKITDLDGNVEEIQKDEIIKTEDTYDDFQKAVLDGLQLAYKVTANSLYGSCGAKTSQIYMKEIAACTTATGREMILMAKGFLEKNYNTETIYGDSVTGDTPLLIKYQDESIDIKTIDSLTNNYIPYEQFVKEGSHKQQGFIDAKIWAGNEWTDIIRVIRHKTNKKIYRVNTFQGCVDVTEDHSLIDKNGDQIKPTDCIIGKTEIMHTFPKEFNESGVNILNENIKNKIKYLTDKYSYTKDWCYHSFILMFETKLEAQTVYYLLRSIGLINLNVTIKNNQYFINREATNNYDGVRFISELNYENDIYVYDIETSKGIFQGGIGSINLKNTDSLFSIFPVTNEDGVRLKGKEAIMPSFDMAIKASNEFKKLLKKPHDLEVEKALWPFVLISKKRYCANKYEFSDVKYKMASMGIVLKRRDNANIVKKIYGGILDIILNAKDIKASIDFLKQSLQDLIDGKYPLEDLIISKSLKSEYKNPDKIAHKVLADRMGEREEGTRPQVNDRIPYVYIQVNEKQKVLQGNRIEHPDYIRANPKIAKPDYTFYITNQITKPVLQVYALILEDLEGYRKPREYYAEQYKKILIEKNGDVKKAKDRWNDLREQDAEKILFEEVLMKLKNKKDGNRVITDYFKVI